MVEITNPFVLMYLGVGCIIAAILIWFNWLKFKEDASMGVVIFDAIGIVVLWGFFAFVFVVLAPVAWVSDRYPFRNMDDWVKNQYEKD